MMRDQIVPDSSRHSRGPETTIVEMAQRALRTIGIAYEDFDELPADMETPPETDLTLFTLVGIIDPLRSDVKVCCHVPTRRRYREDGHGR